MPRKPKILIVEDRVQDMNLTIRSITKAGYDVDIVKARHGVEAIEILERADDRRPDLVLLDWMLPLKSGDEVLAHIRSCPRLKTVPVIVLTTSRDEDDLNTAWGLGCSAYMAKPVNHQEFDRKIRTLGDFWLTSVILPKS